MKIDESFDAYMRECHRYPLLTAEQELMLSRQVQRKRELEAKEKAGRRLTQKEKREVRAGERAKQRVVNSNLRLVVTIANRYARRTQQLTVLDLVQEGALGLIRAVDLFDAARGYKFSTYAYWWIRQGITRALSQKDSVIRLPHGFADKLVKVRIEGERLAQSLGRTPTRRELAEHCGVDEKELMLMLERSAPLSSLDMQLVEGGGTLLDVVADPRTVRDDRLCIDDEYAQLRNAVGLLDERERYIIKARHALGGDAPRSLKDIAADLNLSRSRVTLLESRAMRKLRVHLATGRGLGHTQLFEQLRSHVEKEVGVVGLRQRAQKHDHLKLADAPHSAA